MRKNEYAIMVREKKRHTIGALAPWIDFAFKERVDELAGDGFEKVEVRFARSSDRFASIIHTHYGKKYAIEGDVDDFDLDEVHAKLRFSPEKYPLLSKAVVGIYAWWLRLDKEEDIEQYRIGEEEYQKLRKKYPRRGVIAIRHWPD